MLLCARNPCAHGSCRTIGSDPRPSGHAGRKWGRRPVRAEASRAGPPARCQHGEVPDLSRMRNDYTLGRLREEELAPTWVEQFDRWFADTVAAEIPEPNAVVVATA